MTSQSRLEAARYGLAMGFALLALAAFTGRSHAQLRMEVRPFESMTMTTDAFLRAEPGKPVVIAGELRIPRPGTDKLPAVVLMHASGGVNAAVDRWAQEMNGAGMATFIVDSFSGRDLASLPPDPSNEAFLWLMVDAYRALDLLAKHPRIDPERIAVMGFSMGGLIAIYSSNERFRKAYGPANAQFAAHIGFYGNCAVTYRDDTKVTGKPIRLFHGSADDIELAAPCRAYVARLRQAGADAAFVEFEGAQHGFDWFMFKEPTKLAQARTGAGCSLAEREQGRLFETATGRPYDPAVSCNAKGGTLLYDEAAAAAAKAAVKEFLATTFGAKK